MINEDIDAAIPRPWEPYAKRHIGMPIFPLFGKIKTGTSLMMSLVFNKYKIIIPVKVKPIIAIK